MKSIVIGHMYPREMNIYGDFGNLLTLKRRLEWRGYGVTIKQFNIGETSLSLSGIDLLVGGGGQDSGQITVEKDLQRHKKDLKHASDDGLPMLMICGMYQLYGHEFVTLDQKKLRGIGIFDLTTVGGEDRMIGNVVVETSIGSLVGFENHSGNTHLHNNQQKLGTIIQGAGNNGEDKTEGAHRHNTIGTYMHGPLLPKNPHLADHLIQKALSRRYGIDMLSTLDDTLEHRAYKIAQNLLY